MATRTTTPRPPQKAKPAPEPEPVKPPEAERIPGSLSGNLASHPELRFTASGRPVSNMRIAVQDRVQNPDTGEWEDTEAEFYTINVWGQQAEHAAECFALGDRVVATGYFQDRTYTNRDDEEVTVTEFTARDIGPSLLFKDATIKRVQRKAGE